MRALAAKRCQNALYYLHFLVWALTVHRVECIPDMMEMASIRPITPMDFNFKAVRTPREMVAVKPLESMDMDMEAIQPIMPMDFDLNAMSSPQETKPVKPLSAMDIDLNEISSSQDITGMSSIIGSRGMTDIKPLNTMNVKFNEVKKPGKVPVVEPDSKEIDMRKPGRTLIVFPYQRIMIEVEHIDKQSHMRYNR